RSPRCTRAPHAVAWVTSTARHAEQSQAKGASTMRLSQRLTSLPPYHFAEYNRKIAELRAAGTDVINMSMGDPDLPTPPEVVERLCAAAREPANQRYPDYSGIPELRAGIT